MTPQNASGGAIRHIALFRLGPATAETRARDIDGMRQRLQALVGIVPGLVSMTVEPQAGFTPGNWDLALISEHESADAFAAYQAHPAHHAASAIDDTFIVDRAVVDISSAGSSGQD